MGICQSAEEKAGAKVRFLNLERRLLNNDLGDRMMICKIILSIQISILYYGFIKYVMSKKSELHLPV